MKKFNWGHGLTIFILLFIATMLGMVAYSFQQSNEMIDDNYYQKEMEFQILIDAREKFKSILKSDSFIFERDDRLEFIFPKSTFESGANGTLELVKIDNEKLDIRIPISVDSSGIQVLSKDSLVRGNYRARIKWSKCNDSFYYDHMIFVNK